MQNAILSFLYIIFWGTGAEMTDRPCITLHDRKIIQSINGLRVCIVRRWITLYGLLYVYKCDRVLLIRIGLRIKIAIEAQQFDPRRMVE